MPKRKINWEGFSLAFIVIFTTLLGSGYIIGRTFQAPVPLLAVLIAALVIAFALQFRDLLRR